jgi:GT2 family glycosyltransferase
VTFLCEGYPHLQLAIGKNLFFEVGGFNEGLKFNEDSDLCYRLLKAGYKMLYSPEAKVYHVTYTILAPIIYTTIYVVYNAGFLYGLIMELLTRLREEPLLVKTLLRRCFRKKTYGKPRQLHLKRRI